MFILILRVLYFTDFQHNTFHASKIESMKSDISDSHFGWGIVVHILYWADLFCGSGTHVESSSHDNTMITSCWVFFKQLTHFFLAPTTIRFIFSERFHFHSEAVCNYIVKGTSTHQLSTHIWTGDDGWQTWLTGLLKRKKETLTHDTWKSIVNGISLPVLGS